jgi:hypothetical protein
MVGGVCRRLLGHGRILAHEVDWRKQEAARVRREWPSGAKRFIDRRAGTGDCEPAQSRHSLQPRSLIVRASDRDWRVGFDRYDAMTPMAPMTQ